MFEEKAIASKSIFKGHAFNVRVDTIINCEGKETTRDIVEHADCICAVPVDEHGDILLVRQYRIAVKQALLELPAGGIEPGEDPETAVNRELQEEIGFLPSKLRKLAGFYSSPGFCTEHLHLYLATELKPSRLFAEDTNAIEIVRIKPSQVLTMIQSEQITDAKSVAGLLLYLQSSR